MRLFVTADCALQLERCSSSSIKNSMHLNEKKNTCAERKEGGQAKTFGNNNRDRENLGYKGPPLGKQ